MTIFNAPLKKRNIFDLDYRYCLSDMLQPPRCLVLWRLPVLPLKLQLGQPSHSFLQRLAHCSFHGHEFLGYGWMHGNGGVKLLFCGTHF